MLDDNKKKKAEGKQRNKDNMYFLTTNILRATTN